MGLAVVFAEAPSSQVTGGESVNPTPEWGQLCDIYKDLPADQQ